MDSSSKKLLQKGEASLTIFLGLVLMAVSLPIGLRLAQQKQEVRKQAVGSSWSGPNCDYEDINQVECGYGHGPDMGCSGVPESCWRGAYYPSEDPAYRSYIEQRSGFQRWVGQDVYINWIDSDGWRHNKCSCGPYQVHGESCNLYEREMYKSGEDTSCDNSDPTCSKLQLVDTHPAMSAIGSSISIRVWARPVLNTFCSTGNISGVTVTIRNPNSGNKWTGITGSDGKVILIPTDTYIYNPECFDRYDSDCNGEHYTLISEKDGYLQSYDNIYIKPETDSSPESTPTPTKTPKPTKTPTPTQTPIPTQTLQPTSTEEPVDDCPRKSEGDADCNGVINVLDFSIWRKEKYDQGADETKGDWRGDFNGDGLVKNDDFSIWLNNLD
jgi:hypothetical protein